METTPGGEVDTPDLTTLNEVSLTFSGGSLNLEGLTTIVVRASRSAAGWCCRCPPVYTGGSGYSTTLSATGSGERTGAAGPRRPGGGIQRRRRRRSVAASGGTVSIPALTTDTGGGTSIVRSARGRVSLPPPPADQWPTVGEPPHWIRTPVARRTRGRCTPDALRRI